MDYLLLKYLKRSTTPEEERVVQEWLANDPDGTHAKRYKSVHAIYNGMVLYNDASKSSKLNTNETKVEASGNSIHAAKSIFTRHFSRKTTTAIKWCVNIVAAVLLVFGSVHLTKNSVINQLADNTNTISVPLGQSLKYTLEDGTVMWLNAGTEVEIPSIAPRKSRYVKVNRGEVLFDVAKDKSRPFSVESYASTITVLGTKFNLTADQERGKFSVALLEGSIKATTNVGEKTTYLMKPNDILNYNDNKFSMTKVEDTSSLICWTEGIIDISEKDFESIMRKFMLVYNVNIVLDCEEIPQLNLSRGKIRVSEGLEHALKILQLAVDFDYVKNPNSNTIIITNK